jgi:hypothetical protein
MCGKINRAFGWSQKRHAIVELGTKYAQNKKPGGRQAYN